ncbi:hypothetical protein K439DRAFT_1611958 [Ramaria rubella]|nr:hypothetical protein K439DRAFT_1611958 [Ramaria rubella]
MPSKHDSRPSTIKNDMGLTNACNDNNHASEPPSERTKDPPPTSPLSPSEHNWDLEASLPDDTPCIPEEAQFPDDDYVATSIVSLQCIIHCLIYNFACESDVHYCDLLVTLGHGTLRSTSVQSNWNIFQRMRKEDINATCRDIDLQLSQAERMCERSDPALRLYKDSVNDAGGEHILSATLQEWAKANPKLIRFGHLRQLTQAWKCWSMNPAVDPRETAVVGTSDKNIDQALSDLGWMQPQQVAATFQTHQRLQHQKQYIQRLTTIMSTVAETLPEIVPKNGDAKVPLKITEKIVLTSKPPSSPTDALLTAAVVGSCDVSPPIGDNSSGAPSIATDQQAPPRSCGKRLHLLPFPWGTLKIPLFQW